MLNDTIFNCSSLSLWPSCFTAVGAIAAILPIICLMVVIVGGNFLVVLAVKNEPKLRRQRQNWLIVSLALADMLVGLLVMPLTLAYEIIGEWWFGDILCELWLALDVLFVTASILHICAISLDRYWSVTQPLSYPNKRTPTRMGTMIGVSWLVSLFICLPPLFGWRPDDRAQNQCTLSTELGYVLYSALGSFYIPVIILVLVYARIFNITKQHCRQRLKETERADKTLAQLGRLASTTSNGARRSSRGSSSITGLSRTPSQYHKPSVTPVLSHDGGENVRPNTDCKPVGGRPSATQIYPSPAMEKRDTCSLLSVGISSPLPVVDGAVTVRRQNSIGFALPATTIPAPYQDPPSVDLPTTAIPSNQSNNSVASVAQLGQNNAVTVQALPAERSLVLDEGPAVRASSMRTSIPQHMSERRRRLKAKERQATLLLGLILTAFIASWLPFFAMYVLGAVGYSAPELFFKVFFWLGYCNSGINPIIYTLFNREFKRALCKQLTRPKSSRNRCLPFR